MMDFGILQGKDLIVSAITLCVSSCQLDVSMHARVANYFLLINFINVSSFNLQNVSYPIQMECIEIIDNSSRGWSTEVKYRIHDLENGTIDFYCQCITIALDEGNE